MIYRNDLSAAHIRDLFKYDIFTGIFLWREDRTGVTKAGMVAGRLHPEGYRGIKIGSTKYSAHRLAWLYVTGSWPEQQIDHINGNRDDNRFSNLREATSSVNNRNAARRPSKWEISGVRWSNRDKGWQALIGVDGNRKYLGFSKSLFDAACLRKSAEILYGYTERHGMSK